MNIYELQSGTEKEWIAANTAIQALKFYSGITGMNIYDYGDTDDIDTIHEAEWHLHIINYPDEDMLPDGSYKKESFAEIMEREKLSSDPFMIGSTVY